MKHTRYEAELKTKVELGVITLAEAARRLGKDRNNLAYRFWAIHCKQIRNQNHDRRRLPTL